MAKDFYGEAYARAKDAAKLDRAYERLLVALTNEAATGGAMSRLGEGMLTLACKGETKAFA